MDETSAPLDAAIDARAPGLAAADLIFVFGTRMAEPARLAAGLFTRQLAPLIVVTGGSARQQDGLNEAAHHLGLLVGAGVTEERVLVEHRSTSTHENVVFALPLIEGRHLQPRTVIAVVKRHHRRALITLARHVPSIERIYAVDYDGGVTAARADKEHRYVRSLIADGYDPLVADGHGWRRTR